MYRFPHCTCYPDFRRLIRTVIHFKENSLQHDKTVWGHKTASDALLASANQNSLEAGTAHPLPARSAGEETYRPGRGTDDRRRMPVGSLFRRAVRSPLRAERTTERLRTYLRHARNRDRQSRADGQQNLHIRQQSRPIRRLEGKFGSGIPATRTLLSDRARFYRR